MFEVKLLDKSTNKTFIKTFKSYYLYNKFINKCKYSKKLQLISY